MDSGLNALLDSAGVRFSVEKLNYALRSYKNAGGARGGKARLELNQMPRKALRSKACGERSENFVLLCSTKFRHYFRLSKESEWTF